MKQDTMLHRPESTVNMNIDTMRLASVYHEWEWEHQESDMRPMEHAIPSEIFIETPIIDEDYNYIISLKVKLADAQTDLEVQCNRANKKEAIAASLLEDNHSCKKIISDLQDEVFQLKKDSDEMVSCLVWLTCELDILKDGRKTSQMRKDSIISSKLCDRIDKVMSSSAEDEPTKCESKTISLPTKPVSGTNLSAGVVTASKSEPILRSMLRCLKSPLTTQPTKSVVSLNPSMANEHFTIESVPECRRTRFSLPMVVDADKESAKVSLPTKPVSSTKLSSGVVTASQSVPNFRTMLRRLTCPLTQNLQPEASSNPSMANEKFPIETGLDRHSISAALPFLSSSHDGIKVSSQAKPPHKKEVSRWNSCVGNDLDGSQAHLSLQNTVSFPGDNLEEDSLVDSIRILEKRLGPSGRVHSNLRDCDITAGLTLSERSDQDNVYANVLFSDDFVPAMPAQTGKWCLHR